MIPSAEDRMTHLRAAAELGGLAVSDYVLPHERQALVNDIRLKYLEWDCVTRNRDILFLHGGSLTAHTWDLVALALRQDSRSFALDQRGHGDSEWPAGMDYSRDAFVGDIEGIVEHIGLDRFVLVGQSLGGLNAIEYASRHSDRLAALVIVDVGPDVQVAGARRIGEFTAGESEFDSIEDIIAKAIAFNERRRPELLRTSLLYNLRRLPNGKWTWKYDRRHRSMVAAEEQTRSIRALGERLPAIVCPVLVIRGQNSDVFSDEDAKGVVRRAHCPGRQPSGSGRGHARILRRGWSLTERSGSPAKANTTA
jgi:esterase